MLRRAGPPAALSCGFARCIGSRPRQKSACWWPKACAPLVARRASFAAAPPLLRGNRDLEKLCGKSHVNTSRVTPFFWHPLHKEGQRLEPLPILPKILEVQRAVADARGLQECSPKSPQRRVPTDPGSGGGARATNCLGKPEIGRLGTCRLENGRLWEGLVRVCPVRTPRTLRAGKVLASWNLAFKTPQPPALPEAARRPRRVPRPKLRAEAGTRTVGQIESQLDSIIR